MFRTLATAILITVAGKVECSLLCKKILREHLKGTEDVMKKYICFVAIVFVFLFLCKIAVEQVAVSLVDTFRTASKVYEMPPE